MTTTPLWDDFVNLSTSPEKPTETARSLCSEFLGGAWKTANKENFSIQPISGGMTNLMFKCELVDTKPIGREPSKVLLRIHCQKCEIQLQNEIIIFMQLSYEGLGPKLLGNFEGGRLEEFIDSRMLTEEEGREFRYTNYVAKLMARIHLIQLALPKESQLLNKIRDYIPRIIKNGGTEFELRTKHFPADKFPAKITVDDMISELAVIEKHLKTIRSPVCFSHNDLFAGNILLKNGFRVNEDGSTDKQIDGKWVSTDEDALVLIDFEFGFYNYRDYDIADYLNEVGVDLQEDEKYEILMEKMFDKRTHQEYVNNYLTETYKHVSNGELERMFLTGDIEKDTAQIVSNIYDFQTICNFFWGVWNTICVQENINGLDFEKYFRERFAFYYAMKQF